MIAIISPRVRRNQALDFRGYRSVRPIPACAGEPGRRRCTRFGVLAYPRVCGGTSVRGSHPLAAAGLSPRVRGNHRVVRPGVGKGGPIPACAGEPQGQDAWRRPKQAYPRVCGGTAANQINQLADLGLSPRVRGNHHEPLDARRCRGPIPACAGEPDGPAGAALQDAAYPRVCGGTRTVTSRCRTVWGLSPRVRGNQLRDLTRTS